MKRIAFRTLTILMTGLLAVSLAACGSAKEKQTETAPAASESILAVTEQTETETEVPTTEAAAETEAPDGSNPVSEYETLSAAQRGAGVEIEIPDGPADYPVTCYHAIKSMGILEIVYLDGSANSEDSREAYRIRKAEGEDDISGDYNDYAEVSDQDVGGKTVTLKGNDGMIYNAIWTDGGYSYAINIDMDGAGMTAEEVLALAEKIK